MKKAIISLLTLLLLSAAVAQTVTGRSPAPSAREFWEKFRSAVIKNDKATVAALSRFPLSMPYGVPAVRNRAQMMKRYRYIFAGEANAAQCFPTAQLLIDEKRPKEFSVACGFASGGNDDKPLVYSFVLTPGGWKFAGFDNINE